MCIFLASGSLYLYGLLASFCFYQIIFKVLKVRHSRKQIMMSSILPKKPKLTILSREIAPYTKLCSFFGRIEEAINSIWDLLIFSTTRKKYVTIWEIIFCRIFFKCAITICNWKFLVYLIYVLSLRYSETKN